MKNLSVKLSFMYSQFWKKCQHKSLVPSIVRTKPTAVQTVSPMNQPLWNAAIVSNGWPRTTTRSSPTIRFIRRRLNSERSWKSIIYKETIFLFYSKKAIYLPPNKFCFLLNYTKWILLSEWRDLYILLWYCEIWCENKH